MTAPMTIGSVPAQADRVRPASVVDCSGSSTRSAARPQRMMSTCCECWVPSHVTIRRLPPMAPDDRSDGIRGVDATDQPARVLSFRGDRREGEREAGAPEDRRRQDDPEGAREVEREVVPGARRDRRVDGPVRQRERQRVRGPGNRTAQEHLHPPERQRVAARARAPSPSRCCSRSRCRRGTPRESARRCRRSRRRAARACASR